LSGSGHIAGVVNPPASGKYQFWTTTTSGRDAFGLAQGRAGTQGILVAGLARWLESIDSEQVPARPVGTEALPAIRMRPAATSRVRA